MIADVLGSYLDSLEEREFDAPFMALLRALGFHDIHFLHGSFEFGKDFISKGIDDGVACQFAFQSKAGDIALSDWNKCRGQIDMLRTSALAHPEFDSTLPRRATLVTTGRLVGGAAIEAQEYKRHLHSLGEIGFITWDRETLKEKMEVSPEVGLQEELQGGLLTLLGKIDEGRVQQQEIEILSRSWWSGERALINAVLMAAIIANRLRRHARLDLACYTSLCLVRAAWAYGHDSEPIDDSSLLAADAGRRLFRFYASELAGICMKQGTEPASMIGTKEVFSAHVTYPVRCSKLTEIIGLLGLLNATEGIQDGGDLGKLLAEMFDKNPGASHPISDRWAVSLIPPALLLARLGFHVEISKILEGVTRWIGDHYEPGNLGLAGTSATPDEEVGHLLGAAFTHINLSRNQSSYLATVVLDLAALLGLQGVYDTVINDFLAVSAMPPILETPDTLSQYLLTARDLTFEPNVSYAGKWAPRGGWKLAPHHDRGEFPFYLERIGRPWDHLAVSAVLRDRHFLARCLNFIKPT